MPEGLGCEGCEIRKELEKTRSEKEALIRELEKVKREFEEYKKRHPETTGVANGKPYSIKENVVPQSQPRKPGAVKGHPPHNRKLPEKIDVVKYQEVHTCPYCGNNKLSGIQEIRERVVEDIVVPSRIVTLHRIERRFCANCGKMVEGEVDDALPGSRIGLTAMNLIVKLRIVYRMPIAKISQLFEKEYGLKVSEGEIQSICERFGNALEGEYERLREVIKNANARHIDETNWRVNGINCWLWGFITKQCEFYTIAPTRGHEVLMDVLGEEGKGVDIHDNFSAYKTFAKKCKRRDQQLCWSHILLNAKELWEFYGDEGGYIYQVLCEIYEKAKSYNHLGTEQDIDYLTELLEQKLLRMRTYKSHRCRRFVENLVKNKKWLFVFVKNPDVESTNNLAERALRHPVIARKISGGSRSWKGAKIYSILLSVFRSLQLSCQSILSFDKNILLTSHG